MPAGAFILSPTPAPGGAGGQPVWAVVPNPGFTGLNAAAAGSLASLLHFRHPEDPARASAMARGGLLAHGASGGGRGLRTAEGLRWASTRSTPRCPAADPLQPPTPTPIPPLAPPRSTAGEWLDPASEDSPPGCAWAVRTHAVGGAGRVRVTARSLTWLGAVAWHDVGGPAHGHVYLGDGTRNTALGFMV